MSRLIERPRPVPPYLRLVVPSACWKASKMIRCLSSGMPMPLSSTEKARTWPAVWMLSAPPEQRWPDDGEIDILEHVGFDPGVVHGTMHTAADNHTRNDSRTATTTVADACTAFHKYQLTWNANQIKVGVDDRNYYQYSNDHTGNAEWPFDSPQFLIFNIAVGGDWGGQMGVDDTIWPVQMEVDYVRVYQQ